MHPGVCKNTFLIRGKKLAGNLHIIVYLKACLILQQDYYDTGRITAYQNGGN
jgi:hypothetical protein